MKDLTLKTALEQLSSKLRLSEKNFGGKINIIGKDPIVASRHHIGEATAVLLSLLGMELASVWKDRTGINQDIEIDVKKAVSQLAAIMYTKQNNVTVPYDDMGMVETTDFFKTKDNRWVFIVASLPHLRQKASEVLKARPTAEAFKEAVGQWNAIDLENAMNDAGAACAMVRTREEWKATEQYPFTLKDDLIQIEMMGDSTPKPYTENPNLPLSGIKVIDNTHIYAGPVGARFLADAGADVLRILSPNMPNPPVMEMDTIPGKRSAWLDFREPEMKDKFWELIKDADVMINGYLHLEQFGITPEEVKKVNPNIIFADIRAYGFSGPWVDRGGFEQHGQAVTGFNVNEGSFEQPINPPTYLLNDVMCGLEVSIGIIEALRRRAKFGGSYHVKVSLSRNADWLQEFGLFDDEYLTAQQLPTSLLSNPGLGGTLKEEFKMPLWTTPEGPLGEMSVLPLQIKFSELAIGPRYSGDPNGAAPLSWKGFEEIRNTEEYNGVDFTVFDLK